MTGNKDLNIKILVAYHKPYKLFKNEMFVPIHVGRDIAFEKSKDGLISKEDYAWLEKNTIGDNTGDNISNLNREYCELSAIYWAWKNYEELGNPDYIGLMHYRTFFNLSKYIKENKSKLNTKKGWYSREILADILSKYDMIIAKPLNLITDIKREEYKLEYTNEKCWNFSEQYYPELYRALKEYNNDVHYKNMFILKREDFFTYCEILFNTLSDIKEKLVKQGESLDRALGYHAEGISSLIFMYFYKEKNLKHIEFPFLVIRQKSLVHHTLEYIMHCLSYRLIPFKKEHKYRKICEYGARFKKYL